MDDVVDLYHLLKYCIKKRDISRAGGEELP